MSLPRRSPPVSPVVSSPAAALPVASASVSVYARVVKDGADPEWTAIELAAPVNIDALITEVRLFKQGGGCAWLERDLTDSLSPLLCSPLLVL